MHYMHSTHYTTCELHPLYAVRKRFKRASLKEEYFHGQTTSVSVDVTCVCEKCKMLEGVILVKV